MYGVVSDILPSRRGLDDTESYTMWNVVLINWFISFLQANITISKTKLLAAFH